MTDLAEHLAVTFSMAPRDRKAGERHQATGSSPKNIRFWDAGTGRGPKVSRPIRWATRPRKRGFGTIIRWAAKGVGE